MPLAASLTREIQASVARIADSHEFNFSGESFETEVWTQSLLQMPDSHVLKVKSYSKLKMPGATLPRALLLWNLGLRIPFLT